MELKIRAHTSPLPSFGGARLIWPCVAMGGVAQLAADLIVETLHMSLVADIGFDGLVPFVAYASTAESAPLLTAIQGWNLF